ncbi:hypothetical protein [Chryseobacterium sp. PMSZPI]|uniref:hypothetical protein n=1 Tax=Chryseobacterium sp. PMSZPI TaxID=1033900 RepID=UPI000C34B372|nr:hypothetical protein [Chryseobacterium sp. PMSZPI]PKF75338.1 hypothetical protein CW752_05135 [Chryseobacterium sp. PMSZPI]
MTKITYILFTLITLVSCVKKNENCNVKLTHNNYHNNDKVYYDIKLDSTKNILTLSITNKTGQNILILKPEILFLKQRTANLQNEENNKTKFETIDFDTIKKSTVNIKRYDNIQKKLIDLWQRRKIRQNNNHYFDYGYEMKDYLAIVEKNQAYKEEYFINCTKTDKGTYKIIFDTGFRDDILVNDFVDINSLDEEYLFYKQNVDYPKDALILIQ